MSGENLPGERIESLCEELQDILDQSRPPFGKGDQFRVVDYDQFMNILDEIKMSYPEEWSRSRRILREREEVLNSAADQASSIIADAQQQALTIAGEQEIVRLAQQQADDIRNEAEQYSRETRYQADEYAEQVIVHLEENLKSLVSTVSRCRQQLADNSSSSQSGVW